jgi:predicted flap endonuclease-1-like 5' DNA nuclease
MGASSVASDDSNNNVSECQVLLSAVRNMRTNHAQDGFIVDIDAIQAHGIGAVDISKLKSNGYYTIASVHSATRRNLLKIKGFSEIKVDKVKDAIAKCQVRHNIQPILECISPTCSTAFRRRLSDCP